MSYQLKIEWQKSPAHLFFLCTFLRPHTVQEIQIHTDWKLILGEDPNDIVRFWLSEGILRYAPLNVRLSYKFTISDIKERLRKINYPVTGNKEELVLRLIQGDPEGAEKLCSDVLLFECSEKGRKVANEYLTYDNLVTITSEKKLNPQLIIDVIKWILEAMAAGVIGSAAYDALKIYLEKQKEKVESPSQQPTSIESEPHRKEPDHSDVYYYTQGLIYFEQGHYQEAIPEFTKAIEIDSRYSNAYYARGRTMFKLKSYQQAVDDFDKALKLEPKNTNFYRDRAGAFEQLRNYQQAISDYTKIIELEPDNIEVYRIRVRIYEQLGKYQQAIPDCSKIIELNPKGISSYYDRAQIFELLGGYQQAWFDYSKVIELDPYNASAYYNRAEFNVRVGNLDQALSDYAAIRQLRPHNTSSYFKRAEVFERLGKYQQALYEYTKIIECGPQELSGSSINSNSFLALTVRRQGEYKISLVPELDYPLFMIVSHQRMRSVVFDKKFIYYQALYNRGVIYEQFGDKRRAVRDFTEVTETIHIGELGKNAKDHLNKLRLSRN